VNRYTSSLTTFTVKLTVSYSNGACADVRTKNLTVQPAPLATISSPEGTFAFCENEDLVLEVTGPFTSYSWSTNESTSSITVTEAGVYTVQVTTATGCTVDASQAVTVFESPLVSIQSTPTEIAEGQSAQLEATGLNTYLWEPAATLSSATIPNPVASPLVATTYTVSGVDVNGCSGEAVFELKVRAGSIYEKIKPSPFFSPENGDDFGKEWIIEKILDYPECQVTIYDEKGVKVHEAKPYLNAWDGTFKGQNLPDGVYYFIIKCAGEQKSPKTGSITILR
jgi:gliding motility-associated-like protein